MIKQTILPFKLEETKDLLTAHAGAVWLNEIFIAQGAQDKNFYLPWPPRQLYQKPIADFGTVCTIEITKKLLYYFIFESWNRNIGTALW